MKRLIIIACVLSQSIYGINLHNQTDELLWGAVYNVWGSGERVTQPIELAPQSMVSIPRPSKKPLYDRIFIFSYSQADLKPQLSAVAISMLGSVAIGPLHGDNFYLQRVRGRLKGFNTLEYKALQPLKEQTVDLYYKMTESTRIKLQNELPAVINNPHKNSVATVRMGNELPEQERAYLARRAPITRQALERFLGMPLGNYTPRVSIILSGGGYRALTCATGFLKAAETTGLLDAITYIAALSGSTWMLATWLSNDLPLDQYREMIRANMSRGMTEISSTEVKLMSNALYTKMAFEQPITLVDIYALMIGNVLLTNFGSERFRIYLSKQAEVIERGDKPFPIYTAVRAEEEAPSHWYEFTPYEVGGTWMAAYVPTWAFGRKFIDGTSVDFAPEQSLAYFMGLFGSAIAANFRNMYEKAQRAITSEFLRSTLDKIIARIGEKRITSAEVYNFGRGLKSGLLSNLKLMQFVDAGAAPGFGLPYPPLSGERAERKSDVLIFMDTSDPVAGGAELKESAKYAQERGLKFPDIYGDALLGKKAISVFKDENDPSVPVVIYIPIVSDTALWERMRDLPEYQEFHQYLNDFDMEKCVAKEQCQTLNLRYDTEQFNQMSAVAEFNLRASIREIQDAIRWKINQQVEYQMSSGQTATF